MSPIYLPVYRKNKDFQLVHIDVLKSYAITLKFDFSTKENTFKIIDGKLILATIKGPLEYNISAKNFRINNNTSVSGYEIDITFLNDKFSNGGSNLDDTENSFNPTEITKDGHISTKSLIDIHINETKSFSLDGFFIKFGTEFCKFYIV
jgi:hypothetical protein